MDAVEQLLQQLTTKKYNSCFIILFSYIALTAFVVFGMQTVQEMSELIILFLIGLIIVAIYYMVAFSFIKTISDEKEIKVINSAVVKKENINMGILALFGANKFTASNYIYYTEKDFVKVNLSTFESVRTGGQIFVIINNKGEAVACYPGRYTGQKYKTEYIVPKVEERKNKKEEN